MAARRPALGAAFPTVRARLLAILVAAAIPVFVMAVSISVQSFRLVRERSTHQTELLLTAARARHALEIEQLGRLLDGLAGLVEGQPAADCGDAFRIATEVAPPRLAGLVLVDPDDAAACQAPPPAAGGPPAAARWWADAVAVARRSGATAPRFSTAGDAEPIMVAARALAAPAGRTPAVLVARVRVDWLQAGQIGGTAAGVTTWIALGGTLIPQDAGAAAEGAAPGGAALADLLARDGATLTSLSRSGQAYTYSAAMLVGDLRIVVGVPAAIDLVRADSLLARRIFELGSLLLLGLVAMAAGAHAAVVRPIKTLTTAVGVWRQGGAFDRTPTEGAPREVTELADTFAAATAALRARETELRAASTRQDLLMQEIHHRVKNNLQIVASLLNLQASRIRQPEARAEFQAARDRIRALATLHRHLYAHGELHTIDMRDFLVELCGQLLQALGETPAGGRIRLDIVAPPLELSSDQAVPLALIVTEAVSNAAKYAFPDGRSGHIAVRVELLEHDEAGAAQRLRLTIQDDGVGIPAGRSETETGVRDGIGVHLIKGFARQLDARLDVHQDAGTRYVLTMRLRQDRGEAAPVDAAAMKESVPA